MQGSLNRDWSPAVGEPRAAAAVPRVLAKPRPLAERLCVRATGRNVCLFYLCALIFGWFMFVHLHYKAQFARSWAIRDTAYWQAALALPLEQRIGAADALMVSHLRLNGRRFGEAATAQVSEGDPEVLRAQLRDVAVAIAAFPPEFKRAASAKVAGIYLVRNLGYSGITIPVYDADGRATRGLIFIDAGRFDGRNANEWLTVSESKPFAENVHWEMRVNIESGAEDNRVRGLHHLLLHEISHAIGIDTDFAPPFFRNPDEPLPDASATPFMGVSWLPPERGSFISRYDQKFTQRDKLYFYRKPNFNGNVMEETYRALHGTNFATLYGSANPWEDFAESLALYVHTQLEHRSYEVTVLHDGQAVYTYHDCWTDKRCEDKRPYMEKALGITPSKPVPAPVPVVAPPAAAPATPAATAPAVEPAVPAPSIDSANPEAPRCKQDCPVRITVPLTPVAAGQ